MNHELLRATATSDKALLEHVLSLNNGGISSSSSRSCLKGVTSEGNTSLHTAAGRGYLDLVRMICDLDASLIEAKNNRLSTPLICAARAGHVDVVRYLIDRAAASMLKARNSEGTTAMHEAIRNGHNAVLETLMSADAGLAAVVDAKGFSPLYLAAALGRADMVEVLIRGSPDGGQVSGVLRWTEWTDRPARRRPRQ
jgi:ankyrin repeat protein